MAEQWEKDGFLDWHANAESVEPDIQDRYDNWRWSESLPHIEVKPFQPGRWATVVCPEWPDDEEFDPAVVQRIAEIMPGPLVPELSVPILSAYDLSLKEARDLARKVVEAVRSIYEDRKRSGDG